ncbi:MAG: exodeoxyribonuclease VII small subunit [Coriobacteriales bacterium]|jgi:exodeoxyribonuclease VII small subunit|nr:exodeoxyribonuclease VII small subunit [Coriobacteriales bacterium]
MTEQGDGYKDTKDMTFQEKSDELEGIVRALEGGNLQLEESLKQYERGVKLLKELQGSLNEAKQKVTVLLGEIEPESSDDIDTTLS